MSSRQAQTKNLENVVMNNFQRLGTAAREEQEEGAVKREMSGPNLRIPLPNGNIMKIPLASRPINISEEVDKTAIWKKMNDTENDKAEESKRSNKYFGWASRDGGWVVGGLHGCLSIRRMSNKKHKNSKKKTSPSTEKRLTTMTEEEEILTRNDDSKLGLVG